MFIEVGYSKQFSNCHGNLCYNYEIKKHHHSIHLFKKRFLIKTKLMIKGKKMIKGKINEAYVEGT
jgi:hypothetical protein